jgi:hypothetical protein
MSAEMILLLVVVTVIALGYGFIYPRYAGNSLTKVAIQDLFASATTLLIAGNLYYASGVQFSWLIVEVNWFWFTLLSYLVIEIPVCIAYAKKHNMKFK